MKSLELTIQRMKYKFTCMYKLRMFLSYLQFFLHFLSKVYWCFGFWHHPFWFFLIARSFFLWIIPFLFRFAAQCSFCVILIHQGYSWGYKRKENTINGVNITQYTHKLLYTKVTEPTQTLLVDKSYGYKHPYFTLVWEEGFSV